MKKTVEMLEIRILSMVSQTNTHILTAEIVLETLRQQLVD